MPDPEEKEYGAVSPLPSCGMPWPSFPLGYLVGSWGGGEGGVVSEEAWDLTVLC